MNNTAKIISLLLISVCIISGIIMLSMGISDTLEINKSAGGYEVTTGYLLDYNLYSKGGYDAAKNSHTSDTYTLTYNYNVLGREYTVTTDYGTSFVPEIGSEREIRYNPKNPEEAVIVGSNSNVLLIFMGIFFIIIPLIILSAMFGWLNRLSGRLADMIMGFVLIFISWCTLYLITGSLSVLKIFRYYAASFSLPLIIPMLMTAAGIYLLVRAVFLKKDKKVVRKAKQ